MKVTLADLNIVINNKYDYLDKTCQKYISEFDRPDIEVSVTEEEISAEDDGSGFSRGYLESLAVYRKIADKMPEYDGFLMHGVLMYADGKGFLLTAQSGVGKSTHALMWLRSFGNQRCKVINGDKPLMRYIDGTLYAYGTPWCGKEGLNINRRVKLNAVAFIERAPKNETYRITFDEASLPLFKQIHFPKDDIARITVLELCGRLASDVEFYKIKCTPEPEAAEVAYKAIIGE